MGLIFSKHVSDEADMLEGVRDKLDKLKARTQRMEILLEQLVASQEHAPARSELASAASASQLGTASSPSEPPPPTTEALPVVFSSLPLLPAAAEQPATAEELSGLSVPELVARFGPEHAEAAPPIATNISQLDPHLLVRILQCVDQRTLCSSCPLVSSSWRAASILAIDSIQVTACSHQGAAALSQWLAAHGSEAQVSSIDVCGLYGTDEPGLSEHDTSGSFSEHETSDSSYTPDDDDEALYDESDSNSEDETSGSTAYTPGDDSSPLDDDSDSREAWRVDCGRPHLLLPVAKLSALRRLELMGVEVDAVDSSGRETGLFAWPLVLHGLTSLQLDDCCVDLDGLQSCTGNLQHLDITLEWAEDLPTAANIAALEAAIPQLQQLTHLGLSDAVCNYGTLACVSSLSRLQSLSCALSDDSECTAAGFRSLKLPSSLAKLSFYDNGYYSLQFSPSSTPGLCALPALRELALCGVDNFDPALLALYTQLTSLSLTDMQLSIEPLMAALTTMTQLQELGIQKVDPSDGGSWLDANCAALTASQQLTRLVLPNLHPAHVPVLFPAGRWLPQLQELVLQLDTFCVEAACIARACPALRQLRAEGFSTRAGAADNWRHEVSVPAADLAGSVACLSSLSMLTLLELGAGNTQCDEAGAAVWSALAALTGLRELYVRVAGTASIARSMQLTALQQLTQMQLSVTVEKWCTTREAINTAPPRSPPDVWCQVPGLALEVAAYSWQALHARAGPTACKDLLRTLKDATSSMQQSRQQQQQHARLVNAQVAAEEGQLQGQQRWRQQQRMRTQDEREQQILCDMEAQMEKWRQEHAQELREQQQRVRDLEAQLAALD